MKKINKKAQVSEALVWFISFIIIFFIITLFISATIILKTRKRAGSDDNIQVMGSSKSLEDQRFIIYLLNTPIKDSESNEILKDVLFSSLDYYIDNIGKINLINNDINSLDRVYPIGSNKESLEKDRYLFDKAKEILSSKCEKYFLKIPQGAIIYKENTDILIKNLKQVQMDDIGELARDWTPWFSTQIMYKGQLITIEYRQLKECAEREE